MPTPFSSSALAYLQASFLAIVLPKVLSHGRVCFRGIKCPHRREDAIQDMIGLACYADHQIMQKEGIYLSPTRHRCGCRLA